MVDSKIHIDCYFEFANLIKGILFIGYWKTRTYAQIFNLKGTILISDERCAIRKTLPERILDSIHD